MVLSRENKLWIFGSLAVLTSSFFLYRHIKGNQYFKFISEEISRQNLANTTNVIKDVLNGLYHKNLNIGKPYIQLTQNVVALEADKINDAFSGLGADEDAFYAVLNRQKDKVAVSQIASFYQAKFNKPLLNEMNSELSSSEIQKANQILQTKPNFRIIK